MNEIKKVGPSKLFKLKKWLTVSEAARHLSSLFEETVGEADVLRLALDGHLKLSINFVNQVYGKRGKLIPYEDEENLPAEFRSILASLATLPEKEKENLISGFKGLGTFKGHFLHLDKKITTIDGIWDIPMVAGQLYVIENEYQKLFDGPRVETPIVGASFFVRVGGDVCRLYEKFDESFVVKTKEGEKIIDLKNDPEPYYPAGPSLPDDSVLVVRTNSLREFEDRYFADQEVDERPPSKRQQNSDLHIIGALLEVIVEGQLFSSEEKLRDHIADQYRGYSGCASRTLAGRFAEVKKLLRLAE